ncbi:ABC transporter permease [Paenibacillus sp. P96]|uniref:ABC transporter permease n=1 Tax=Paenibacillus zeirhizosphaerae TaxID=2987519 RepID=A0ABT9FUQ8_9BACL|nr:ABC transporter permease [Paenibacillus sp. P96]MDP4098468.1 ABC transporter permease [Paenibacillus sp. P96]
MDLKALHSERRAAFWGQVLPYLGYVLQSGLAALFMIFMIVFAASYTSFILNLPPDLPIRWIMLLLALPVAWSSFRTYLNDADIVFLRPQEYRMHIYFSAAKISGVVYKTIGLLLLLTVLWPIYIRSEESPRPLLWFLLLLVLLKLLFSYGGWQELRMASRGMAAAYRLLRWVLAALTIGAWVWQPPLHSLPFILLVAALYYVVLRLPVKHRVPWEHLIWVEQAQAGRVMRTLGWFVDVPEWTRRVTRRRWLAWLGSRIPWKKEAAYRYLLVKTFVRTEPAGIVSRLLLLGLMLIWILSESWMSSAVYLLFVFLIGVQLTSLRQAHRDSLWLQLYPIPEGARRTAFLRFYMRLVLPAAVILWLPLLAGGAGRWSAVWLSLTAGLLLILLQRSMQAKKWASGAEEE